MLQKYTNLPYRPDIDGLRAIAVLAVVLFHISFKLVPGGFIGVDIFFVISGFLITKIILPEILENRFSFKDFYTRRIRRIFPVFLLVIIVTIIVGNILLLPEDLDKLLASVRHALLFRANVYFSKDRGYFDISSEEKPILHIWSLSVEEQYYFFWPVLLLALYATGAKLFGRKKSTGHLFAMGITLALITAGFVLTQAALESAGSTTRLYFLLQTRFSELMVGSFVAMLPEIASRRVSSALYIAGLLAIFLSFLAIDRNDPFPGYSALLPCLGAALVLHAGQNQNHNWNIGARILSWPVLVHVGLLSYSIYLWHWPILAFMRYTYGSYVLPWSWNVTAFLVTMVLSYASYSYLEKKIKRAALSFRRAAIGIYLVPSAVILITCSVEISKLTPVRLDESLASFGDDVCHGNFNRRCLRGDNDKPPSILVIGDSHAAALNSFIDVIGQKEHWSAEVLTASSCSPVFEFDEMVLPPRAQKDCAKLKEYVSENYRKFDAIFIASYWAFHLGWTNDPADRRFTDKFKVTIETMAKHKPVYVFSDVPQLPISPLRLIRFASLHLDIDREQSQQYALANQAIKKLALSVPNVHWVDITSSLNLMSPYGMYRSLPTYMDDQHLNMYGSRELGKLFSEKNTLRGNDVPSAQSMKMANLSITSLDGSTRDEMLQQKRR